MQKIKFLVLYLKQLLLIFKKQIQLKFEFSLKNLKQIDPIFIIKQLMNKPYFYQPKTENSYNWEGVMQFLYNQYQNVSQKQNIWALQKDQLKQQIKQLQGKIIALQNINKELKSRNSILELSLRQMKIKNHENKIHQNQQNFDLNAKTTDFLPKVPQRRPKPNKNNLSKQKISLNIRMLCSLGIPQLLQDIKKDLKTESEKTKAQPKKSLQLDLSKMDVQPRNVQNFQKKLNYEVSCSLQGHLDGVRQLCFINYNNQLKQIVSASEDCSIKVWQVKKNLLNKIQKATCIQTIRQHTGAIFTCIEGDGYVFTGGMDGIIRAYDFKNHTTQKKHLTMKWKSNDDQKLEPLWQLIYDKNNKLLVATSSEMTINAYKIPQIQQERISANLKMKPHCQFLYKSKHSQQQEEFIPTAVCIFNQNLIASYFNSSSLVNYDIETQKIVHQLNYPIEGNLSANKLISHPRCIIGAYEDCNVRMFDQHKMIQCFKAHKQPVMAVSLNWNNANSLFSCGQDGFIKLWDMRKLKDSVWQVQGHLRKNDEAAHCIQTNFDGLTISGGADAVIKIYSPTN